MAFVVLVAAKPSDRKKENYFTGNGVSMGQWDISEYFPVYAHHNAVHTSYQWNILERSVKPGADITGIGNEV